MTPTYLKIWPFILPCYGNPFNLNKWFKRKLKKDKFSSLLFPLSLLQKLTQQWSWAMLACNLHSKHCNVTQNLYLLPVQPRFGALNPRWHCVIKVYTVAMTYCNLKMGYLKNKWTHNRGRSTINCLCLCLSEYSNKEKLFVKNLFYFWNVAQL